MPRSRGEDPEDAPMALFPPASGRAAAMPRLLDLDGRGELTAAHVRLVAQALGKSERTVWRWLAAAREDHRLARVESSHFTVTAEVRRLLRRAAITAILDGTEKITRTGPLRHTHGATRHAFSYLTDRHRYCPPHYTWSPSPDHVLDTRALPELAAAHRHHQHLLRHPYGPTAWTWAHAITTRWYDHHTHLSHRWHHRLAVLAAANPHIQPAGQSWALLARPVITYPDTINLARHLTRTHLPHQTRRPGRGPVPHTHPVIQQFLATTAHDLGLPHLAPPPDDLLWTWIHHHTHRS